MSKKELADAATLLLRSNGFTWAGNIRCAELSENRAQEKYFRVLGGMSKKKNGMIAVRRKIK